MVVQAVRPEAVEHALADDVLNLLGLHRTVEGRGNDELDVLHSGLVEHLDDGAQHPRAVVG